MEDKNKQAGVIAPGDANLAPPSSSLSQDSQFDPYALSDVPVVSSPGVQLTAPARSAGLKPWVRWSALTITALVLIGGAVAAVVNTNKRDLADTPGANAISRFGTTTIPLDEISVEPITGLINTKTVMINGTLTVRDGLVVAPTVQPSNAVEGQIYYDINSNSLAYFNGTSFVSVGGEVVTEINELTGNIPLGAGLADVGGQLVNTGVLSVQGQTGNVTLSGGAGVSISGTTITNTGVISVSSSSPTLIVTNDGNGNIDLTLNGGGTGTVTSSGGTADRIAKFTTGQNIEDSLLSEAGATVTVNGNLSATGTLALGTPLSVSNGGTGAGSLGANGVLVGNGSSAITSVVSGAAGLCLVSTAGAPTWATCNPPSSTVNSLNGLTGALTIANATGLVNTITIDDASTSNKGIAQFNSTNFSVTGGNVNTIQNISAGSSPTFSSLTLSGNLTVQGGTSTLGTLTQAGSLVIHDGSSNTVTIVAANLSADRIYTLPDAGGDATLCVTAGNCIGGTGGAPNAADYLVASLNGTLTNERALAGGSNINLTDGGANGNMTVATVQNPTFTTSVTTPALQSSGALVLTSAAGNTVAIDAATTIELQDSTNVTGSLDVSVALNVGTGNAFAVNSSGVITAAAGITSSGTIVFSALDCTGNANGGALTTNGSGQLICSDDEGGGGGGITGSGAAGTIPLFDGATSITNSIITQSGTTITVAGDLVLTTDLTVSNGGTGASSFTTNGVLYGNNTGALQVTVPGTSGQVLVANAGGVPTFVSFSGDVNVAANGAVTIQPNSVALGGDTTGDFVANLGSLTGLSTTGNSGEASTPTLSVLYGSIANTAVQGNVSITCPSGTGNLTGGGTSITLGTGGACGNLNTVNDPTFNTSVTTPNLTLTGAGSSGSIVVGNLGQGTTYTLPDPGGAAATICLSTGNCATAGTAGGDLTGTYPNPTIAKLQNTNLDIDTPLAGHILIWNGTNSAWENHALSSDVAISETGVATIQSNAVALGGDTTGNYAIGVTAGNGISVTGSPGEGWSPSVAVLYGSSANTAVEGDTSITVTAGTNLTGGGSITLGAGGTVTLDVANSPTFSGTLAVQGATATVGTAVQAGSVVLNDGSSNTGTIQTASLGTNRVYILPDVGTNANICLDTGNCAGSGSGVTTSGGTTDFLPKFSASQNIEDSLVSDDGSTVTINGTGNFVVQGGTATLGTLTQAGTLSVSDGSSHTISIVAAGVAANRTFTLPETGGPATFCMSTGNCVGGGGGSAPSDAEYLVLSLHGSLSSERSIANGSNIAFTDGGANGNFTVATVQNPTFTTSVTTPALQSSGALVISSGSGTVAIDATTTIELQDNTNVTGVLDVSGSFNVGTGNAFAVSSGGAITAAAGITSSGTITFSGLNCTTFANGGSVTTDAFGVLSCSDDDGAAANTITGNGTNGTITMFTGTNTVADSIITQTGGNTINIAGTLTLTTDLAVSNGGTGASSFTSNGVLYGNNTGALQVTAAGTSGQVLVADAVGVPTFVSFSGDVNVAANGAVTIQPNSVALGGDTTGDFVANLGTLTGLSTTGNSGEGSTPTLSVLYGSSANTAVQGNTAITCPSGTGNLTGGGTSITLGTGGTCADLNTVNNPTFSTSVTTPSLILTGAGSNGTLQVASLGQGTTYTLPDPGQVTASICLSTGNCTAVGTAGGDLTGSYPNPTIASLQGTTLDIDTPAAGHVLIYNGTNTAWENHAISSDIAISETGVATIQANAVTLGNDTTGDYVANLGALTGLSTSGNTGEGSTPTLSVLYGSSANTAVQGNTAITCPSGIGNLSGGGTSITLGTGGTCGDISITNSPTFSGTLTVNTIDATGAMTIGDIAQSLTLQGNATTTITANDSGNTTTVGFGVPTADTTINFPALLAGNYTVCTSSGNCGGVGATLQTAYTNSTGGSTPEILLDATRAALTVRDTVGGIGGNLLEIQNNDGSTTYFAVTSAGIETTGTMISSGNINSTGGGINTGAGAGTQRIDNSGNLVNIGNLTASGAITIASTGANSLQLQTNGSTRLTVASGGDLTATGDMTLQGGGMTLGADSQAGSLTLYDGGAGVAAHTGILQVVGTLAQNTTYTLPDPSGASASICLDTGNCAGLGQVVDSLNGLLGDLTIQGTTNQIVVNDNGTDTITLSTPQDIHTAASPQFANLTLTGDLAVNGGDLTSSATLTVNSAGFVVDGSGNFVVQDAATFNGTVGLNSDTDWNLSGSENITVSLAPSGTLDHDGIRMVTTNGSTSGTQNLMYLGQHAAATGSTESLLVLDNAHGSLAIPTALSVTSVGGGAITTALDVSDANIQVAINIGANDILSNGVTISSAELNLLDGHDVALVDTNDAVNTAITGTGALNAGSITSGFGSIDVGTDSIQGGTATLTGANALTLGTTGTNTGSILFKGSTAASGTITLTLNTNNPGTHTISLPDETGVVCLQSSASCGFAPSSGSANYIQNGTALQTNANFNIQSTATTSPTAVFRALGSQTADVIQVRDSTDSQTIFSVSPSDGSILTFGDITANTSSTWSTTGGNSLSIQAGGALNLGNSGSASINIGTNAAAHTIGIGSSASGDNDITLGSVNSASTLLLEAGTAANSIQIGNGNTAHGIQIGTGAAVQTITIGSTDSTSALTLQAGTGDLNIQSQGGTLGIGNNAVAQTIQIGNATGATTVSILCGTGTCGFGNNATDHSTTLGSSTGTSVTNIQSGTGGISIVSGANITLGTSDTAGTLLILDTKTDINDPTGVNGAMYYNSSYGRFRCHQNNVWVDCIGSSAREYIRLEAQAPQTDLANEADDNDHIKFDTVANTSGSGMTLDTTSTYTEAGGDSRGRITLAAGKTYRLHGTVPYVEFNTASGYMEYAWYDVTSGAELGTRGGNLSATWGGNITRDPYAEAIFTPSTTTLVELRLVATGDTVDQIGFTASRLYPSAYIEVLSDGGAGGASAAEYMRAEMAAQQTTDLANDNHVKFDTVDASSGSSITLDTTSAYSSGVGASLGRFTLKSGKTYRLNAHVPYIIFTSSAGAASLIWYDVTNGAELGSKGTSRPHSHTASSYDNPNVDAIFSPTTDTLVEFRISAGGTSLQQIGNIGDFNPSAFIEVLSDGTKIAQFQGATSGADGQQGFVPKPVAGQEGSLLVGDGSWSTGLTFVGGNLGVGTANPAGILEVISASIGDTDHISLLVDHDDNTDPFSLGMSVTSGRKFTVSAQGGSLRQALSFGDVSSSTETVFGISTSSDSGASWVPSFTVSQGGVVSIGTSDTTGALLVLDTKTGSGDPTGADGGMYYNSNLGKFRCYEAGAWVDCIGGANVGEIKMYAGSTAPSGWLLANGAAVSRATYADLFALIGTTYGAGDGSTTFNLPNFLGRTAVGRDAGQTEFNVLGETGGAKTHTLTASELPSHSHTFSGTSSTGGSHTHNVGADNDGSGGCFCGYYTVHSGGSSGAGSQQPTSSAGSHSHTYSGTTSSVGSGSAHNNLQPYLVVNYIIKY